MTDPTLSDRLDRTEQTAADHSRTMAQTNEILPLLARRYQEHDQSLQETREGLCAVEQILQATAVRQERNAVQIEANTMAIAELRALMQDRYNGNGNPF